MFVVYRIREESVVDVLCEVKKTESPEGVKTATGEQQKIDLFPKKLFVLSDVLEALPFSVEDASKSEAEIKEVFLVFFILPTLFSCFLISLKILKEN